MTLQDTVDCFSIPKKNVLEYTLYILEHGDLLLCCVFTKKLFTQVFVGNQVGKILQEEIVVSRTF